MHVEHKYIIDQENTKKANPETRKKRANKEFSLLLCSLLFSISLAQSSISSLSPTHCPTAPANISTNVYTASGRPYLGNLRIPASSYANSFCLNGEPVIFINDLRNGDKMDIVLNDSEMLREAGYIRNEKVRVIVLLGREYGKGTYVAGAISKIEEEIFLQRIEQLNGRLAVIYSSFPLVGIELPYSKVCELANEKIVGHVFIDKNCTAQLSESVPLIKPPEEWSQLETQFGCKINGTGIKIAILDTGIDKNHPDLDDLDDNPSTNDPKVIAEKCFTDEGRTEDGYGHGTHCASIAAGTGQASNHVYVGVAPGAFLFNGKVLTDDGWGYESWVVSGIEWAVNNSVQVISLSLGSQSNTDGADALSLAVDWASDQGVVCAVAAGNRGSYGMFSVGTPACSRKAITVGASSKADAVIFWSSRGPTADYRFKPDIVAPGVNIVAARASGTSMGTPLDGYYTSASGTSMATPHVAGAVALILQVHEDWNCTMVKAALINTAKRLTETLFYQGNGRIDIPKAINTSILAIEPSLSFGLLDVNQTSSVNVVVRNIGTQSVTAIFQTIARSCGVYINGTSVSPSVVTIVPNNSATITLQVGSFTIAPPGWCEGEILMNTTLSLTYVPYIFAVKPKDDEISLIEGETVVLNTAGIHPHKMLIKDGFLYVGTWLGSPSELLKVDLSTYAVVGRMSASVHALAADDEYLYVGLADWQPTILKIDLQTFGAEGNLTFEGHYRIEGMVIHNGYLYASTSQSGFANGFVLLKIDLVTFTPTAELSVNHWDYPAETMLVINDMLYAEQRCISRLEMYVSGITRINLASFTTVGTLLFDKGEYYAMSEVALDGYIYVGLSNCYVSEPSRIFRINVSSFSIDARLTLAVDELYLQSLVVAEGHLYAGLATIPGKIVEIDPQAMNRLSALTFSENRDIASLAASGSVIYATSPMWYDSEHPVALTRIILSECIPSISDLVDSVFQAEKNQAYFIFADPHRMTRAVATYDVASGNLIYGACQNTQNIGFDTNAQLVSQEENTRGRLLLSNKTISLFGGWSPHWCVDYLQRNNLTPVSFVAPIENGKVHFKFVVTQTSKVIVDVTQGDVDFEWEDYFVIMTLTDENNNHVFVFYGFDWKGTWAAGIYVKEIMSTISSYTSQYYIFHWSDTNNDGIPQPEEVSPVLGE